MPRRLPAPLLCAGLAAASLLTGCGAGGGRADSPTDAAPRTTPSSTITRPALAVTMDQLAAARLPATCGHPAADLNAGKATFGDQGSERLDLDAAVFTDVTGDGADDAVVPLACDGGGVTYPEHVLVLSSGAKVVADIDLGKQQQAEHADVASLRPDGDGVDVAWTAYAGAGFGKVRFTGRLNRDGGSVGLDRDGSPLLVYLDGGQGVEVDSPADADRLTGAPQDLRTFVAGLVGKPGSAGCTSQVTITRVRTDGYATGGIGERCAGGSGPGELAIWSRAQGRWKQVLGTQEGWYCSELRKYLVPPDLMGDTECYTDDSGSTTQRYRG